MTASLTDYLNDLIQSASIEALPEGFSYPVEATDFASVIPQFCLQVLDFIHFGTQSPGRRTVLRVVIRSGTLAGDGAMSFMEIFAVPARRRAVAKTCLKEHALPMLRQWLHDLQPVLDAENRAMTEAPERILQFEFHGDMLMARETKLRAIN